MHVDAGNPGDTGGTVADLERQRNRTVVTWLLLLVVCAGSLFIATAYIFPTTPSRRWWVSIVQSARKVTMNLDGVLWAVIWSGFSAIPLVIWLRGDVASNGGAQLPARVVRFSRASLRMFLLFGVLAWPVPWRQMIILGSVQVFLLLWSLIGVRALMGSVLVRRRDLAVRSLFCIVIPLAVFLHNVAVDVYFEVEGEEAIAKRDLDATTRPRTPTLIRPGQKRYGLR